MTKNLMVAFAIFAAVMAHLKTAATAATIDVKTSEQLTAALAGAAPGTTVAVPAGTFKAGNLSIPSGVTVKGAGAEQTIIDAQGKNFGMLIKDASNVTVSGITLQGSAVAGIRIEGGGDVTLSGLRVLRNLCGVNVMNTGNVRIENTVIADNRNGIALNGVSKGVIVNCTLAKNYATGFGVSQCRGIVAFNNIVAGSDIGIYLPLNNEGLQFDYNIWNCTGIGSMEGEYVRHTVAAWSCLSGLERHSVGMSIVFANPLRDEYWAVSSMPWRPSHVVTSGWGVREFAGIKSPVSDMRGEPWGKEMDAGAFATARLNVGSPDGKLVVKSEDGVKSAGVFRKDGRLLCYLFQGLPLHKGEYEFWLSGRDFLAKPIEAGDCEVRMLESQVAAEHMGYAANKGIENYGANANEMSVLVIAYADDGQLVAGTGWQERKINITKQDPATGKATWAFGGDSEIDGIAMGTGSVAYVIKAAGKVMEMVKIDTATGEAMMWPDKDYRLYFQNLPHNMGRNQLAFLNGRLFLADPPANRILHASAEMPDFKEQFQIPSPTSLSGDDKNGLVWLVSENKTVLAINDKGEIKQRFEGVKKPLAVAVRNGRMAIASAETGKVHMFDAADPAALKPLFTIGTGEDPVGPIQPDRFEFKDSSLGGAPCGRVGLAVGPKGEISVLHNSRIAMFDPQGKLIRDTWADFCWDMIPIDFKDGAPTGFYNGKGTSFQIDAKKKTWQPYANWVFPKDSTIWMFFPMGGKRYAMGQQDLKKYYANGSDAKTWIVCELNGFVGRPVSQYMYSEKEKAWVVRSDSNNDGVIDDKDEFKVWTDAEGKAISPAGHFATVPYIYPARDGSLRLVFQGDHVGETPWREQVPNARCTYIRIEPDAKGTPCLVLKKEDAALMVDTEMPSPFDLGKTDSLTRIAGGNGVLNLPDGGWMYQPWLQNSPATKMLGPNGGGTDVAGFDKTGHIRWFRPLTEAGPIIGLSSMNGLQMVGSAWETEMYSMDKDGLATGNFALPLAAHYRFGLMDHPNVFQPFKGNDGKEYFLMGEFMSNCVNWFRLINTDSIRYETVPLKIDKARSETLRTQTVEIAGKTTAKSPVVKVRKLQAPMPIDGDLVKWRKAGIAPMIVITPEGSAIKGPADTCATVRMAWEGDNLYVQVLKFDDKVVMYQPASKFYMQDCIEMSINGYTIGGFKYNITRVRDGGDFIFRDRWWGEGKGINKALDPQLAPRKVTVLDNANDVEERKIIESLYGVDLSKSPVIVYEFKLPVSEAYNKDQSFNKEMSLPECPLQMKSGSSFRLGFLIDDSDQPGADVQKCIAWPATYNTWAGFDQHAEAILE